MSWKEYHLDNKTIADWLPWGALTHENVMRNKDDSVLGVIRYKRFDPPQHVQFFEWKNPIFLPTFRRGWSIWLEEQYAADGDVECFLTLCWNPFLKDDEVVNGLEDTPQLLYDMEYDLAVTLRRMAWSFPKEAEATVLSYQEIVDYLTFSLTLGRTHVAMPDVPVDLDVFLTAGIDLDFASNHVRLGDEKFLVLTLPSVVGSQESVLRQLTEDLHGAGIPCRHVQRLLLFDKTEAEKELRNYTGRWCPSRKYIKDILTGHMLQRLNGYYNNQTIALVSQEDYARTEAYLEKLLGTLGIPYIVEDYNAKDLWWGSLPGLFRAAVVPPICGFRTIEELLATKSIAQHTPEAPPPPLPPELEELIVSQDWEESEYVPT